MIMKIIDLLNKIELNEMELRNFDKYKENYNITDKLFYKNDNLYSIKIIYKNFNIVYQLKENRKIILETKNNETLKNKILRILEIKKECK